MLISKEPKYEVLIVNEALSSDDAIGRLNASLRVGKKSAMTNNKVTELAPKQSWFCSIPPPQ